ncbi:hypothetical protein L484_004648 [Morus notabilis]|uniref:Uncharacterized protein n=1 Tax=Morus notabilis TaxID=981085 RepID=W9RHA9_9ROSA|nr:hypothetical protein L484_004648 [Morus notabilis]
MGGVSGSQQWSSLAPLPILLAYKSRKISSRLSFFSGYVQSAPQALIKPSPPTYLERSTSRLS